MIKSSDSRILIIYTGGTIGMITDAETGVLHPFDFSQITEQVPELRKFDFELEAISFENPIDSSDMTPKVWVELAELIESNYEMYDGFVVLHGSDTMAYSASALSFMLENLSKPVVFTGSQLPIGIIRTDGKENLITAIEIAAAYEDGKPIVPEVSIYFEYNLYRANRTTKINSEDFEAFESFNYPKLADAGINIKYHRWAVQEIRKGDLWVHKSFDPSLVIIHLYPGITKEQVKALMNMDVRSIVLHTYGSGNAPSKPWFIDEVKKAVESNKVVVNVTQCKGGQVDQEKYATGSQLFKMGVISARDMTIEATIVKLMILMGEYEDQSIVKQKLTKSFCGELTPSASV